MDFFNRPLQLLNTFFSTLGLQTALGQDEVKDLQHRSPVYETQWPTRSSIIEDDHLKIFQTPMDTPLADNTWKNAELLNGAGDRIGFIEDMVVSRDRSDAGFLIKLAGPGNIPTQTGVFVSVDDIETQGSHFVCKMPPNLGGLDSVDYRNYVSLASPPTRT